MRRALVAVFDKQADAQQALSALLAKGFSHDDARLTSLESAGITPSAREESPSEESLGDKISRLFGFDKDNDNRTYSEAVRHGHCVLTVDVDDEETTKDAEEIMERYDPVDIDEHAAQWHESDRQGKQAGPQTSDEEVVIPIVEEEMQVGKREVPRGRTRIRAHNYTVPDEKNVRLHEEHTDIHRRPADRPATDEDKARQAEFETHDTAEEPIVGKQARVVEEVVVSKKSSDQTKTVKDNVRRTDVDVENVDDDGKTTSDEADKDR